jgi:hypothetical protein
MVIVDADKAATVVARGRKAKRSVRINPAASRRRSRHPRHQPKIEIPIAIARARGFLPRGLSYACRRPKRFTLADRQLQAANLQEQTLRSA